MKYYKLKNDWKNYIAETFPEKFPAVFKLLTENQNKVLIGKLTKNQTIKFEGQFGKALKSAQRKKQGTFIESCFRMAYPLEIIKENNESVSIYQRK